MTARWTAKLRRLLLVAEDLLLALAAMSLMLVAVAQIILRNAFGSGLLWADAYMRIAVLWIAMLGAMVASRHTNHIAVDLVSAHLPDTWQAVFLRCRHALTALICVAVAWFSGDFVVQEAGYADIAFAGVPVWWCEAILPIGFAVMAWRYSAAALFADTDCRKDQ
ncbi:TRAP transporter small permease [Methylomonas sp. HYX-M1]|uniref:TRAP transporter small permease n=1 Tax=Methylomonas sp. HYX-M1 TaxID=3139307 RepID=UPI00345B99A6